MVAALAFFTARDDATTDAPAAAEGPGVAAPAASSAFLRAGNVAITAPPGQLAAARRLADEVAGPPSADLRAVGQAVVVRRVPPGADVIAQAWQRELRVATAADPRLREFVEFWLGRGGG